VGRHLDRLGAAGDHADRAVVRTFELSGLAAGDDETLAAALGPAAAFAPAEGGAGGLLYGTPAALRAAADAVGEPEASERLTDALAAIRTAL
jgi:hypothetical protein